MSRRIYSPSDIGAAVDGIAQIAEGGTEGTTPPEALAKLNVLATSELGAPNGVGMLDENGRLVGGSVPVTVVGGSTIQGSLIAITNSTNTYNITNYDFKKSYEVSAVAGGVSINGSVITYNAPSSPVSGGFYLNGRLFDINVTLPYVAKPQIVSPANNVTNQQANVTITTSNFSTVGGADSHLSSSWEIATDPEFINVVVSSENNTSQLTSWIGGELSVLTLYYCRVKHTGVNFGSSQWSDTVTFTTKASFTPTAEQAILSSPSPGSSYYYGMSVALSEDGNYAVIGEYQGNSSKGAAYIYYRQNNIWILQATLTIAAGVSGDRFGYAVTISRNGEYVAVGANGASTNMGKTYVYTRSGTTWTLQATINGVSGSGAGSSLSFSDDCTLLASGGLSYGTGNGIVYLYSRSGTTWTKIADLTTGAANIANLAFGTSVSLSSDGSYIVVGAPGALSNNGQIFVFKKLTAGWATFSRQIISEQSQQYFGRCVGITKDAYRIVTGGSDAFFSYINNNGTYELETTNPGDSNTGFGQGVSLSSNGLVAAISSYAADPDTINNAGKISIYKFNAGSWSLTSTMTASDKAANDNLGQYAVSLSGDATTCLVGAWKKGTTDAGGAYVFS